MILSNAPINEAVVSNVSEIGEFRIRNSAKAFSILSSGLYANKIRAIIRELSCNAVDSHAAAGKKDVPFDVHLPNQLEPYFSIRDYGIGLSHEQVTQIYTTYFESTKTASNEFIGALGLGSKSPFSYTDNFTVTAIKDGKKGIYSAFINENSVPSIALMMQETTNDPAGVEVKFSVNDYQDFSKFRHEAKHVYTYFELRPVVGGCAEFEFTDVAYDTKNIVPGIHSLSKNYNYGRNTSYAIMGNIAYPIDIPQDQSILGELKSLLDCGLEIHFGIGELDFQASREGLSYIPQTVNSIKAKLEELNSALVGVLAKEADAIENLWKRALFLNTKRQSPLWSAAVDKHLASCKLDTYNVNARHGPSLSTWYLGVQDLAKNYNISIRGIQRTRAAKTIKTLQTQTQYSDILNPDGSRNHWQAWDITVSGDLNFIVSNAKTRGIERVKHHYRESKQSAYSINVYILEPVDRTKDMKTEEFFKSIVNPPTDQILSINDLIEQPKAISGVGQNVTIMRLENKGSTWTRSHRDMVWRDAGKIDNFDDNANYYYVPLRGFLMQSTKGYTNGKDLHDDLQSIPGLFDGRIYGVRKGDIEAVKKRKNWINLETHIEAKIKTVANSFTLGMVKSRLDSDGIFKQDKTIVKLINPKSPFAEIYNTFKDVEDNHISVYNVQRLCKNFAAQGPDNLDTLINKYQSNINNVYRRYPLLRCISHYSAVAKDIADYINMIDAVKGI